MLKTDPRLEDAMKFSNNWREKKMVKGISKQIIEIKCTNSEYFEKALLFVTPGNADIPERELKRQASLLSGELSDKYSFGRSKKAPILTKAAVTAIVTLLFAAAAAGVLVSLL